jgi:PAS domain S-box-containing protein
MLRHYWLLSGAAVYGLGLWMSHFIMLLATDNMIIMDWTSIIKLAVVMVCAYVSFLLLGSKTDFSLKLLTSSMIMAVGSNFLNYACLMSDQILNFHLNFQLGFFALTVCFLVTSWSYYLFERKNGANLILPGMLLGLAGSVVELLGTAAFTFEYSFVLTSDRLNDYMQMLSVVLGIATLLIFAFSLLARFVDRRFNAMNERYKLLVENSIDTIAIISDERWEYINDSGLQMFEAVNQTDLLGIPIYQHLQPKCHEDMRRMLKLTEQGMGQAPIELVWMTMKGKMLHTEVVQTCTRLSGKPVFQVIIRDISERKKNEELLINSEKLYVAGQLAAGIAHEIRNPLTSLKGFLQLIASGRQAGKNYYDIMKSELNRIESIVSELLMLSKPQIYELTHKDIRHIMGDTMTLLEAQAILHNIEMELALWEEPLWVRGVENQLKQVFINVLKNAIEAMIEGGKITITCEREGDRIVVRIDDHGPGIPEEQLSKIGQPFYTTKDKGTGLGLMVSYKIVHNHQGSVRAQSRLGIGTTFEIILPYSPPDIFEMDGAAKVTPIHRNRPEESSL